METLQETPPRRQFQLPEMDNEFLNQQEYRWETIINGDHWLIIHDLPLPAGYNHSRASVALRINASYPDCDIDMWYFNPPLSALSEKTINNLSNTTIDGQIWQQWSRHRTPQNPWRPGEDCVETHLLLVQHWLEREINK